MRGKKGDVACLQKIIMNCEYIKRTIENPNVNHDKFVDEGYNGARDLCAFYVGQIGEYVKNLTDELKGKHPEVLWAQIAALRNRIVHDYDSVNYDLLWRILTVSIPELKEQCRAILSELDSGAKE